MLQSQSFCEDYPCFFTRLLRQAAGRKCRIDNVQRVPNSSKQDIYYVKRDSLLLEKEYGQELSFKPIANFATTVDVSSTVFSEQSGNISNHRTRRWLERNCETYLSLVGESHFTCCQLVEQIISCFDVSDNQDALQFSLFELLGFQGIDFITEILSRYNQISLLRPCLHDFDSNGPQKSTDISNSFEGAYHDRQTTSRFVVENEPSSLDWLLKLGFNEEYLQEERVLGLQKNQNLDLWKKDLFAEGTREVYEKKGLPQNTKRTIGSGFEEIFIPRPSNHSRPPPVDLVDVGALEDWCQDAFRGTTKFNAIQSAVFTCAYYSSENMLVCAPTGAGKTNIAMLALLQQFRNRNSDESIQKVIYIAPMKALAQEVVRKFSDRLRPLKFVVKEYTGDMQLSKQEVHDSHLLVCTPEKYDAVTRKGGDGSLGTQVALIIIDEIHLLADDRGAVLETIVARTQRYIESSQKMVRIVGLSATLPNYKDVAAFLRVNHKTGLFYFGPEFRPVPLDQTYIGLTESNRQKRNDSMNLKAYENMIDALEKDKQVMIFVNARSDTVRTLEAILDLCNKHETSHLLENVNHEKYTLWKKNVDKSRSKEVQYFFNRGMGIHHAGLLRSDRSLTEQLFETGLIRVLCCTATLAWGVNLPAHTVIIKGTDMYDPERGGYVDLSVLDILQIFGRAGRPQYDVEGHAIMITQQKSLTKYLGLLAQQTPIESSMTKSLVDHLNAEIVNGTVNNIKEGVGWISYTFLFVRMKLNPLAYGMKLEEVFDDPQLEKKRYDLIRDAAEVLDKCMMVRYDRRSGNLGVTDLGRIASHYYIKHDTIDLFNRMLSPHLVPAEALHLICVSSEFDQLKCRPDEVTEVEQLRKNTFLKVKGTADDTACKVNILLQSYLVYGKLTAFTLQSDTNYITQNSSRITRALFEWCLRRGWASLARFYLTLGLAIDRRCRFDASPLRQFSFDHRFSFPKEVLQRLEVTQTTIADLLDMDSKEVGQLVHNMKIGSVIKQLVEKIPSLSIDTFLQPITSGIIRLRLYLRANFEWDDRLHGFGESFWVWIEDSENEYVYHSEQVMINKKTFLDMKSMEIIMPVQERLPKQYFVRIMSDSWVGCESLVPISFESLKMPSNQYGPSHTDLLNLHPVSKKALKNERYERLYSFDFFNPVQSQAFFALYHTDRNILIGAPTGSGKTIFAELAILRLLNSKCSTKKIVYVAPLKALARERLMDWRNRLGKSLGLSILELTGEVTPDLASLQGSDILIVTPEKWDSISRNWRRRNYVTKVGLVVIDEIHLLGVERGAVLEILVSRMRFISSQTGGNVRFVGLSTALANARDLGDWLGIPQSSTYGAIGLFNFRPSVRPVPMTIHIQGFPGKHYCPRMATMNKPAYAAILEHSPEQPVLIFVSSRRQTRLTALDLISCCAADDNPRRFLHMSDEQVEVAITTLSDTALRDCIPFGVAIHHAGLNNHDRSIVEELFLSNKIQILVCTSTLAWGVNLPCHLVIVKGSEFYDAKTGGYVDYPVTDILQMIGRAGRPQFDIHAVACIFVQEKKKHFYKKFLHEPFPVESSLHLQLHEHFNAEIANETISCMEDAVEYLTWTYFYRRLLRNPSYYGLEEKTNDAVDKYMLDIVGQCLNDLKEAQCIHLVASETDGDNVLVKCTSLGVVASTYYLKYISPLKFQTALLELGQTSSNNRIDLTLRLLKILCDACDLSEVPVRHNEEHLNAKLCFDLDDNARLVSTSDMLSPHTKCFLLLLAHMKNHRMPISDYNNDLKSLLDQTPRLICAMTDIAAELGQMETVRCLLYLSQCLRKAIDLSASEAELLQSVKDVMHIHGWRKFDDFVNLPELLRSLHLSGCQGFVRKLRDLGLAAAKQVLQKQNLSSSLDWVGAVLNNIFQTFPYIKNDTNLKIKTEEKDTWIKLQSENGLFDLFYQNKQYETKIELIYEFPSRREDFSWWIALSICFTGAMNKEELLALKKVGRLPDLNGSPNENPGKSSFLIINLLILIPDTYEGECNLILHVICDAVLGTDFSKQWPIVVQKQKLG